LEGSPYYGTVHCDFGRSGKKVAKRYYVKLARFVNKFDKPLAYFKLHGSIFNRIVYVGEERVRLKHNYAVSGYVMEKTDPKTGEVKFEDLHGQVAPDFLSGTTNKIRYYTDDEYYKILLRHFDQNLFNSELLIIIGYGFQDAAINKYLERCFLSRGRQMVVIDPNRPNTDLLNQYKAKHIAKGVTEVTYEEYLELIPSKPNA
jgi:hypothetical protein